MKNIRIINKKIGEKQPVFIIAEAGVNHNGKIHLAKKLIDIAVRACCDAIKFQTYKSEGVVTSYAESANYANKNLRKKIKQLDMLKNYELKYEEFEELKKYCDSKGIIFLSTPHSFDAIDFLEDLVPAYKFGSGDITNTPALKYAAKKGKPIILGTGMATIDEIKNAINIIRLENNNKIVALHCTTDYPCKIEDANLNSMVTMKKELDCIIGYSDHTLELMTPIIATALGAKVIEKHFTIDKKFPGPDHTSSLNPNQLKKMVSYIRKTEKALGYFEKKPTKSEEKNKKFVRKSIIAKYDIEKGTKITRKLIDIKRPGIGLSPSDIEKIIGKKAKIFIKKDELFLLNMVE